MNSEDRLDISQKKIHGRLLEKRRECIVMFRVADGRPTIIVDRSAAGRSLFLPRHVPRSNRPGAEGDTGFLRAGEQQNAG